MNSIHDMGGMHGLGPLKPEEKEPVWHAPWEARMYAISSAMGAWRRWPGGAGRRQMEAMPAADYLRSSYYEKWLYGNLANMIEYGLITREEAETGHPDAAAPKATPPLKAAEVAAAMVRRAVQTRTVDRRPRFQVGDTIRTKNIHPLNHTRLPRYARDKIGAIAALHGAHVFPDSSVNGHGEDPQELYTVRFQARVLWGEAANPRDTVMIDLWESYLERA
jgi:nitrile hydratase beta subunit